MTPSSKKKLPNRNQRMPLLTIVIVGLVVAAALIWYFSQESNDKTGVVSTSEALDIPFTKQGALSFLKKNTSDTLAVIDIEVADNDEKRARGLMYRKSMPPNAGMLFIHDYEQVQSFWMKNTYIPLDMIFVNREKKIVTIHPNTATLKEWSYASTEPALYVVEVNAGFCYRNDIETGDSIEFEVGDGLLRER